jgi:predicted Zn-dependent protease
MRHLLALCLLAVSGIYAQRADLAASSQKAKQLMAEGRFFEAAAVYKTLVQAVPGNAGLVLNLGMAQHMAGDDASAIPTLEAALKLRPDLPPALIMLGDAYMKADQPAKALPFLRKAAALDPGQMDVQRMLVQAASALNLHEEAAMHLRKLLEAEKTEPILWSMAGKEYEALAQEALEKLENVGPNSAYLAALVADSRVRGQQNRAAFFFYRQALERDHKLRGAHAAIAGIYRRTGHPDWAAIEERAESDLGPLNCTTEKPACDFEAKRYLPLIASAKLNNTAAGAYWQARAWNALAVEAFSRLEQLPESAPKLELQAEMLRDRKQYAESVKLWRAALAVTPGDATIEHELVMTLCMAQDFAAAQPMLDRLLKQEPGSAALNFLQGDVYLNQQLPEKALPYLQNAVAADPRLLQAKTSLARAYLQLGQADNAAQYLKEVLPTDDDGTLHFELARAYRAAGKAELAKQAMESYRELKRRSDEAQAELERQAEISAPKN